MKPTQIKFNFYFDNIEPGLLAVSAVALVIVSITVLRYVINLYRGE